ncbi:MULTISPECIES: hypothetical protein [Leuconostoc]|uniref:hypothetical protein n=1 Tax=Leuconostoc TaxID=1243 RepID=UPI0032DFDBE1
MIKTFKLVWPYIFRWLKNSLVINGGLFFAYGLATISLLPQIGTKGISNITSSQIKHMLQVSQQVWIGLLIAPLLIATIILLIDVITDLLIYRSNKRIN